MNEIKFILLQGDKVIDTATSLNEAIDKWNKNRGTVTTLASVINTK